MKTKIPEEKPRETSPEITAKIRKRTLNQAASAVLLTAVTLVIAFSILLVNDSFGIRSGISAFLHGNENDAEGADAVSAGLPVLTKQRVEEPDRLFFSIKAEDALSDLVPAPFYTREFVVTYGWGDRQSARRWKLTVDGDCWMLSDPPDEIFCDGALIYAYVAGYASVTEGVAWEPEVGAADIEEIAARFDNPEYAAEVTASEKTVEIRTIEVSHLKDYFEIDVESGLILTEQRRYDNDVVRSIRTESLTVGEERSYREQYDARVSDFLAAHLELSS